MPGKRSVKRKKRKFYGNRFTKREETDSFGASAQPIDDNTACSSNLGLSSSSSDEDMALDPDTDA